MFETKTGLLFSKISTFLIFSIGFVVLVADAWIRHVRCMVAGLMIMIIAVSLYLWRERKTKKIILLKTILVCGLMLWMIVFVVTSILIAFNFYDSVFSRILILTLAGLLGYIFSKGSASSKVTKAAFIGMGFIAISLLLDGVITYRFDSVIFRSAYLWAGYFFIFIGTIASSYICQKKKKQLIN
jgi:magnesium-transporting ATPase (P-type)